MNLIQITDVRNVERLFDTGKVDLAVMHSPTYGFVAWAHDVDTSTKLLHSTQFGIVVKDSSRIMGYYEFRLLNVISFQEAVSVISKALGKEITDKGTDTDFLLEQ